VRIAPAHCDRFDHGRNLGNAFGRSRNRSLYSFRERSGDPYAQGAEPLAQIFDVRAVDDFRGVIPSVLESIAWISFLPIVLAKPWPDFAKPPRSIIFL
jgi:hypothetical protein